mmetsp:Transcript_33065/g.106075  ORF Transcript_33065/g.106075 Transcript_33065/m.106075 type:complete len:404 (+) Transcript_33065:111-1322(+)
MPGSLKTGAADAAAAGRGERATTLITTEQQETDTGHGAGEGGGDAARAVSRDHTLLLLLLLLLLPIPASASSALRRRPSPCAKARLRLHHVDDLPRLAGAGQVLVSARGGRVRRDAALQEVREGHGAARARTRVARCSGGGGAAPELELPGDHPVGREGETRVDSQPVPVHAVDEHEQGERHRERDGPRELEPRKEQRRDVKHDKPRGEEEEGEPVLKHQPVHGAVHRPVRPAQREPRPEHRDGRGAKGGLEPAAHREQVGSHKEGLPVLAAARHARADRRAVRGPRLAVRRVARRLVSAGLAAAAHHRLADRALGPLGRLVRVPPAVRVLEVVQLGVDQAEEAKTGEYRRHHAHGPAVVHIQLELALADGQQPHLCTVLQRSLVRVQHGPSMRGWMRWRKAL